MYANLEIRLSNLRQLQLQTTESRYKAIIIQYCNPFRLH
jgi:hypothetical protein